MRSRAPARSAASRRWRPATARSRAAWWRSRCAAAARSTRCSSAASTGRSPAPPDGAATCCASAPRSSCSPRRRRTPPSTPRWGSSAMRACAASSTPCCGAWPAKAPPCWRRWTRRGPTRPTGCGGAGARPYGEATARAVAAAHAAEPPLDLTLKDRSPAARAAWSRRLDAAPLPWGSLRRRGRGAVAALPGYREGAWWVQDAAAALAVELLGAVAGAHGPRSVRRARRQDRAARRAGRARGGGRSLRRPPRPPRSQSRAPRAGGERRLRRYRDVVRQARRKRRRRPPRRALHRHGKRCAAIPTSAGASRAGRPRGDDRQPGPAARRRGSPCCGRGRRWSTSSARCSPRRVRSGSKRRWRAIRASRGGRWRRPRSSTRPAS